VYLKLIERGTGGFHIIETRSCSFRRHPDPVAVLDADTPNARVFPLAGNAYLLNERGQTIETFLLNGHDRKTGQ
jgi:hypothetical protein